MTTADGGQIFGFDVDQNGNDGVLASARTINAKGEVRVSMETFDQSTGAITKSFAVYQGMRNEYGVDGIFAGDIALVTRYVTPKGQIYALRRYEVMNPVTAQAFTGAWTPPIHDVDIQLAAENQATSTSVVFAIELKNQDKPVLLVSDIARNTFSNVIHLDPNLFGGGDGPQLGQYTAANQAVIALSPDGGAVGGQAPINVMVDLTSGKTTQFVGFNFGPYGAGYVNGLAVDPNTGVAATTTELNAEVEFYNMANQTGITAVQLPCTGSSSQLNSGSGIAVDPVHKLFLVTETNYCNGTKGSAIVVYDEGGHFVEAITGFAFAIGEPTPAINPGQAHGLGLWRAGLHPAAAILLLRVSRAGPAAGTLPILRKGPHSPASGARAPPGGWGKNDAKSSFGAVLFLGIATAPGGQAHRAAADLTGTSPTRLRRPSRKRRSRSCTAKGWVVAVAVVDRYGETMVALRSDNAAPHAMENARRKAYTALTFRTSTKAFLKRFADNDPVVRQQATLPNVVAIDAEACRSGVGAEVIAGLVASSGSPGGDEPCVQAGLDKVADQLQVRRWLPGRPRPGPRPGCPVAMAEKAHRRSCARHSTRRSRRSRSFPIDVEGLAKVGQGGVDVFPPEGEARGAGGSTAASGSAGVRGAGRCG